MGSSLGSFPALSKKLLRLPEILSVKERALLGLLALAFLGSSAYLVESFYISITEIQPAFGGNYREGVVGQPRLVNPIYAGASDVDRDLAELLFAGLMKYGPDGKI